MNILNIYDVGEDQYYTVELNSSGRYNSAMISANGKVFRAGGSNYPALGNFADVDIYDKETGEWTVEYLSLGRTILWSTVACGSKVFFAGGHMHTPSGPMNYTKVIDIYDTETSSWSTDSLSIPRSLVGCVACGE